MLPQLSKIDMLYDQAHNSPSFEKIMLSPHSSSNSPSDYRKKQQSLNVHAKAFENY